MGGGQRACVGRVRRVGRVDRAAVAAPAELRSHAAQNSLTWPSGCQRTRSRSGSHSTDSTARSRESAAALTSFCRSDAWRTDGQLSRSHSGWNEPPAPSLHRSHTEPVASRVAGVLGKGRF